jgi:hypothetical protein
MYLLRFIVFFLFLCYVFAVLPTPVGMLVLGIAFTVTVLRGLGRG